MGSSATRADELVWPHWSPDLMSEGRTQKRFVILDLEAVWCHWCHVMAETTYRDPKVNSLLKGHYLTIRADQDANPDLSARYGNWGWPATIIFAPDGTELVKRRGYFPPEAMASLLQAVIDDPTPGPSIIPETPLIPSAPSAVSAATIKEALRRVDAAYDTVNAGWGTGHKFIDTDSMDWALRSAERGDERAAKEARETLDRAKSLIDPVWGGIYQYSDNDDWQSPHFEKIMWYQASALREYAFASALFHQPAYADAARSIYRYLTSKLLSPSGAFYTSQDADVDATMPGKDFYKLSAEQRQNLGREPSIDTHIYARENGWAISGLIAYSDFTGDQKALTVAKRAANWIVLHRRRSDGVFTHDAQDRGGPFLGDTLAMGNALLDLYASTGERNWLSLGKEIQSSLRRFRAADGGFYTALVPEDVRGPLAKTYKAADEQIATARLAVRLWRYLGQGKDLADHAMSYLNAKDFVDQGDVSAGLLLANDAYVREPTHITIVGVKEDPQARRLHDAGRRYAASNKRLDWWDRSEGSMPNDDVTYPDMPQAAAFACGNNFCSLPAFTPEELSAAVSSVSQTQLHTSGRKSDF